MMKNAIAIQDDTDPTVTVEVDPDADDAEASTLLDSIAQGGQPEADTEEVVHENRRVRRRPHFFWNRYIFVHSANGGS